MTKYCVAFVKVTAAKLRMAFKEEDSQGLEKEQEAEEVATRMKCMMKTTKKLIFERKELLTCLPTKE